MTDKDLPARRQANAARISRTGLVQAAIRLPPPQQVRFHAPMRMEDVAQPTQAAQVPLSIDTGGDLLFPPSAPYAAPLAEQHRRQAHLATKEDDERRYQVLELESDDAFGERSVRTGDIRSLQKEVTRTIDKGKEKEKDKDSSDERAVLVPETSPPPGEDHASEDDDEPPSAQPERKCKFAHSSSSSPSPSSLGECKLNEVTNRQQTVPRTRHQSDVHRHTSESTPTSDRRSSFPQDPYEVGLRMEKERLELERLSKERKEADTYGTQGKEQQNEGGHTLIHSSQRGRPHYPERTPRQEAFPSHSPQRPPAYHSAPYSPHHPEGSYYQYTPYQLPHHQPPQAYYPSIVYPHYPLPPAVVSHPAYPQSANGPYQQYQTGYSPDQYPYTGHYLPQHRPYHHGFSSAGPTTVVYGNYITHNHMSPAHSSSTSVALPQPTLPSSTSPAMEGRNKHISTMEDQHGKHSPPSTPSRPHRIWRRVEGGEIQDLNVPSGPGATHPPSDEMIGSSIRASTSNPNIPALPNAYELGRTPTGGLALDPSPHTSRSHSPRPIPHDKEAPGPDSAEPVIPASYTAPILPIRTALPSFPPQSQPQRSQRASGTAGAYFKQQKRKSRLTLASTMEEVWSQRSFADLVISGSEETCFPSRTSLENLELIHSVKFGRDRRTQRAPGWDEMDTEGKSLWLGYTARIIDRGCWDIEDVKSIQEDGFKKVAKEKKQRLRLWRWGWIQHHLAILLDSSTTPNTEFFKRFVGYESNKWAGVKEEDQRFKSYCDL